MKKHFLLALISVVAFSCSSHEGDTTSETQEIKEEVVVETITETEDETGFIHTVFFWMDSTLTDEQISEFEAGMENLLNIESIYHGYYGPPAMTPREVVDNSYDYAFVVHFKSKQDQDLYQKDSLHLQFIADYKSYWTRIQIYDNLVNANSSH
ncbi:Dabb family protein [Parvicella tangerina]|uniref:Stress-response A/B barrel domain-containing protein n=1 Tax=Parvicella tangerina TaxID=2829795 RepID=A0A916NGA1_9FLAO|nr:Dabb family protein [Parvicella tangerina]CAG5080207.1 hypothetical protein CRYO30217_01219 [Parvicella tangerina]